MSDRVDEKASEGTSEEKSWPWWLVAFLGLIGTGLLCWVAVLSIFDDYTIYYKDEAFLGHAQYTNAEVVRRYHNSYENTYTFECGKSCTEHYKEKKLGLLKYEVNGVEYESDVWVVYQFDRRHITKESVSLPDEGERVSILYNLEDPNDIRLRDDLMIKEMNGSWFDLHGHWVWVVIWGIVGLVCGAIALGIVIVLLVMPILGFISKEK